SLIRPRGPLTEERRKDRRGGCLPRRSLCVFPVVCGSAPAAPAASGRGSAAGGGGWRGGAFPPVVSGALLGGGLTGGRPPRSPRRVEARVPPVWHRTLFRKDRDGSCIPVRPAQADRQGAETAGRLLSSQARRPRRAQPAQRHPAGPRLRQRGSRPRARCV